MAKKITEMNAKDAEEQVISLANAGYSPSKIGIVLRDEHAVKNFRELTGKSILNVLEENKLTGDVPEDLLNLIRKSVLLLDHLENNSKDYSAKRGYELTVSKIRKLGKYYVKKGKLPAKWRYDAKKAALLVK